MSTDEEKEQPKGFIKYEIDEKDRVNVFDDPIKSNWKALSDIIEKDEHIQESYAMHSQYRQGINDIVKVIGSNFQDPLSITDGSTVQCHLATSSLEIINRVARDAGQLDHVKAIEAWPSDKGGYYMKVTMNKAISIDAIFQFGSIIGILETKHFIVKQHLNRDSLTVPPDWGPGALA